MKGSLERIGEVSPGEAFSAYYAHVFKIVVVGHAGAGKTALVQRFTSDTFSTKTRRTIAGSFSAKTLRIPRCVYVRFQVWDISLQSRYAKAIQGYCESAHAVVIVFALNDRESFDRVPEIMSSLDDAQLDANHMRILVGNKSDLEDEHVITATEAMELAQKYGCTYAETSAKIPSPETTWNIFYGMAKDLYARFGDDGVDLSTLSSINSEQQQPDDFTEGMVEEFERETLRNGDGATSSRCGGHCWGWGWCGRQ